jgi:hypothetical protein
MQEVFEKIIERLRLSEYNHAICGKDSRNGGRS